MNCVEVIYMTDINIGAPMNYYLLDYENINSDNIKDLAMLSEGDGLVIFYSEACKNLDLDMINVILKKRLKLEVYPVVTGTKNALDFQLASYMGRLIGSNGTQCSYYIISNDKGFDCLCEFWKTQNIKVERIGLEKLKSKKAKATKTIKTSKIANKTNTKNKVANGTKVATLEELKQHLAVDDAPEDIFVIFNKYKTKQAIKNGIDKLFRDSKKSSDVYKKLKPLFKEKGKT